MAQIGKYLTETPEEKAKREEKIKENLLAFDSNVPKKEERIKEETSERNEYGRRRAGHLGFLKRSRTPKQEKYGTKFI